MSHRTFLFSLHTTPLCKAIKSQGTYRRHHSELPRHCQRPHRQTQEGAWRNRQLNTTIWKSTTETNWDSCLSALLVVQLDCVRLMRAHKVSQINERDQWQSCRLMTTTRSCHTFSRTLMLLMLRQLIARKNCSLPVKTLFRRGILLISQRNNGDGKSAIALCTSIIGTTHSTWKPWSIKPNQIHRDCATEPRPVIFQSTSRLHFMPGVSREPQMKMYLAEPGLSIERIRWIEHLWG